MSDLPAPDKSAPLPEDIQDPFRGLFKGESSHQPCIRQKETLVIYGVQNVKAVTDTGLEVFNAVAGGGMDAAGALVQSYVLGKGEKDLPFVVEGMYGPCLGEFAPF